MAFLEIAEIQVSISCVLYAGALVGLLCWASWWRILLTLLLLSALGSLLFYKAARYLITAKLIHPDEIRSAHTKFTFLEQERWVHENERLHTVRESINICQSKSINGLLDELVDLILSVFIDSWYLSLSTDRAFQNSLKRELVQILGCVKTRIQKADIPSILVLKVLPILNTHFKQFAQNIPHDNKSYSYESQVKFVRSLGKNVHEDISIVHSKADRVRENAFFRRLAGKALSSVLSEEEVESTIVTSILREVLGSSILGNLIEMLSEGDFLNQMLIKFMGDSLQRRSQVKRLREALEKHTKRPDAQLSGSPAVVAPPSLKGKLTKSDYLAALQFIEVASGEDLRSLLHEVNTKMSLISNALDPEEATLIAAISHKVKSKLKKLGDSSTLHDILSHSHSREEFFDYLDHVGAGKLIELYVSINDLKTPLVTADSDDYHSLEFADEESIKSIYDKFLENEELLLDNIDLAAIKSYLKDLSGLNDAKRSLFNIQQKVFGILLFDYLPRYLPSKSPQVHRSEMITGGASADTLLVQYDVSSVDHESLERPISPAVYEAVQESLEQILNSKGQKAANLAVSRSQTSSNLGSLSSSGHPSIMAGLTSSNLKRNWPNDDPDGAYLHELLTDTTSDNESIISNETQSDSDNSRLSSSEILMAAPGDLSISEKLRTIDKEINSLREQVNITFPLLRKAELTNNVSELNILKRLQQGLEREIASKELQRQHWIIQENENSLFGKSKIRIPSYMSETKNRSEYIIYIIEVQKFSHDDPSEIVAGWVVARRFSQFYQLHEYLKRKSPKVSSIKFPKKSVLNFQKKQLLEIRRQALEKYLQEILNIPEVCSDPILRSFLSSENFLFGSIRQPKRQIDDLFGGLAVRFQNPLSTPEQVSSDRPNENLIESIKEMQKELKQFDDSQLQSSGKVPFVKPISDLLIDLFDIGSSKSWIRGRALLILLQQVLGSAVEKKVPVIIKTYMNDLVLVLNCIRSLKETMFPEGKFSEPPPVRNDIQRNKTREEARAIFEIYLEETCGKLFGSTNTRARSRVIFELFQNDILNKLLLFQVIEVLVAELFPNEKQL